MISPSAYYSHQTEEAAQAAGPCSPLDIVRVSMSLTKADQLERKTEEELEEKGGGDTCCARHAPPAPVQCG